LSVYVYQARIMQNQLHTSVWPYLEWLYNNSHGEFYINVENKGIGPAIVKSAVITIDGKPMKNNAQLFNTVLGTSQFNVINSSLEGRVMSAGESIEIFHIYDSIKARAFDSLTLWTNAPHTFELTVCYCSVYGDCWTVTSNGVTESICK
jgi:hypothetical protein